MDAIAVFPWFQLRSHNLCAALPNFRSSEDYDHHVIANHLQIKHDQHNPTINQGSSKCCLSEIKGKTHVGFNEVSLQDDGEVFLHFMFLYQSYLQSYNDVH